MIQLSSGARIYVGNEPVNFVKGMFALSGICRTVFNLDPLSGAYFVFRNQSGDSIRVLVFDGDGLWLCGKKFATGKLRWWPSGNGAVSEVEAREFLVMLWRGDGSGAAFPKLWKKV
jgi:transposase